MVMLVGMVLALLVGWLAGMVTRQRSSHWCPVDGSQLKCLECARAGLNVLGSPDDSRPAAPVVAGPDSALTARPGDATHACAGRDGLRPEKVARLRRGQR